MSTYTDRETRMIRRMMRSRLGRAVEGPDGTIHGFFNEQLSDEETEAGVRPVHARSLELPAADLGTIAKGTVLTIEGARWKVWNWPPRRKDDGLVVMLYLTPESA